MPAQAELDSATELYGRAVWFRTGSQEFYGDETLRQVAEQSRAIADGLNSAPQIPVRVVWQPVLTRPEDIRRVMLEANRDDSVLGLIAWMHTFSAAKRGGPGRRHRLSAYLTCHAAASSRSAAYCSRTCGSGTAV